MPSRDDCTAWKTRILKTQTFEDNIKVKAVRWQRSQEVENIVKRTTESELDISKRRPPSPRGICENKERVSELIQKKIRRGG